MAMAGIRSNTDSANSLGGETLMDEEVNQEEEMEYYSDSELVGNPKED